MGVERTELVLCARAVYIIKHGYNVGQTAESDWEPFELDFLSST